MRQISRLSVSDAPQRIYPGQVSAQLFNKSSGSPCAFPFLNEGAGPYLAKQKLILSTTTLQHSDSKNDANNINYCFVLHEIARYTWAMGQCWTLPLLMTTACENYDPPP